MKKLLSAIFSAFCILASTGNPAHAVVVPFGGGATGTDPLGGTWQATNSFKPSWGEPGLGAGTLRFNAGNFSNGAGNWANEFDFTFLSGVDGAIDTTPASGPFGFEFTTRFSDITKSELWDAVFVSPNEVHFLAPAGSRIDVNDEFFINVSFTGPVDPANFSFAALWTDAGSRAQVPEPATLALLGVGLFGVGVSRRRTRA